MGSHAGVIYNPNAPPHDPFWSLGSLPWATSATVARQVSSVLGLQCLMNSGVSASSYQSLEQNLFGFEMVDAAAPEEAATGSTSSLASEAATPAVSAAAFEVTALPETGRLPYHSVWRVPTRGSHLHGRLVHSLVCTRPFASWRQPHRQQ